MLKNWVSYKYINGAAIDAVAKRCELYEKEDYLISLSYSFDIRSMFVTLNPKNIHGKILVNSECSFYHKAFPLEFCHEMP